ncbi:hypothetical protein HDK77DRAFT_428778 [Phyllosticta capitalensis]
MGLPMWPGIENREDFPKSGFSDTRESDFAFRCERRLFNVHREILRTKRGYLELFCNPRKPFGVVMREDRQVPWHETPRIALAMLRWCYTGVFIENAVPSTGFFPRIHNIDKDIFRVCVLSYAVAVEHGLDKGLLDSILETFQQNLVFFMAAAMNMGSGSNSHLWPITQHGVMEVVQLILKTTEKNDTRLKDLVLSAVSSNFMDMSTGMRCILREIEGFDECVMRYRRD